MAVSLNITDDATRAALGARAESRALGPAKDSLLGLTREELAEALTGVGVPERQAKMRVQQLWHWLYVRGVSSFDDMRNISKELRATLAKHFTIARPEIVEEQVSNDGTRKWLFRFPPRGAGKPVEIETVYIPEEGRGTLCISSQVGCTLTCSFCHTGTQKLVRNLTAEEILVAVDDRARPARRFSRPRHAGRSDRAGGRPQGHQHRDDGHGRAALQFRRVKKALLIASDGDGLSLSKRRITLSTSGVVPEIEPHRRRDRRHARDLAACGARRPARPAGADQQEVSARPVDRCLPQYPGLSNARRITFEYVMLKDVNDSSTMPARW
jgi:23S rRNA (adenine2503-C2)-methyltransferase